MPHPSQPRLSRRTLIATAAAASLTALPTQAQPAKYRRMSLTAPGFPTKILENYKKAIRAMLALPPTDPRNWYRMALNHTVDCPHGNWWFLPWHRAYTGHFEQVVREMSGDPDFALPYWDWTKEPRVPAVMFEDVLTPTDPAFIASFAEFKAAFEPVVQTWWDHFSDDQTDQLLTRGLRFPADLWFDIGYPKGPMFFDRAHARGLTKDKPDFDPLTASTVTLSTLLDALSPRDFTTFGSFKTLSHSAITGFGVLEGFPHNKVHNNVGGITTAPDGTRTDVGGFMQSNLSPVDPLFLLHHGNIDRIWDVWSRKQAAKNYPLLPQGADLTAWSREQFLFFTGPGGKPVTKTNAGDYATIGDFDYDYQPGSGEEVVPTAKATAPVLAGALNGTKFAATQSTPNGGTVPLPSAVLATQNPTQPERLLARVTVAFPPDAHSADFDVVAAAAGTTAASGTRFAGSLSMFGHHFMAGPVTFMVPLSQTVAAMNADHLLAGKSGLTLSVAPAMSPTPATAAKTRSAPMAMMHAGAPTTGPQVLSVDIEAF